MKYDTLDDLVNNAQDSMVHITITKAFDGNMVGTILHQDGRQSHFCLDSGRWILFPPAPIRALFRP